MRQRSHYRLALSNSCGGSKRRASTLLNHVFPEYDSLLSRPFDVVSKKVLSQYPTPKDMLIVLAHKLTEYTLSLAVQNESHLEAGTKEIYTKAAAHFERNWTAVERTIQAAVARAWRINHPLALRNDRLSTRKRANRL